MRGRVLLLAGLLMLSAVAVSTTAQDPGVPDTDACPPDDPDFPDCPAAIVPIRIDAGEDTWVEVDDEVRLVSTTQNGTGAQTFQWEQLSGPNATRIYGEHGPSVRITAGNTSGDMVFRVTVTDDSGSASDDVQVTVIDRAELSGPVAHAGNDVIVDEGTVFTLDARGSSATEAPIVSYLWNETVPAGGSALLLPSDAEGRVIELSAPDVRGRQEVAIVLTATDDYGSADQATIIVTILDTTDLDHDGALDFEDNCEGVANPSQADRDGDGLGDQCDDSDKDGSSDRPDGIVDALDNCVLRYNPRQEDADHDGIGDVCDDDADGDNVLDTLDNCIGLANDQRDTDRDELGDACDDDLDGDGIDNVDDICPFVPDDASDEDGDGIGDACEDDFDGDGFPDALDLCPAFPSDINVDLDGDGKGDPCDDDIDGDGTDNGDDNCPRHENRGQDDLDGDGLGDACDADVDGDGLLDNLAAAGAPDEGAPVGSEALFGIDDREAPGIGFAAIVLALAAIVLVRRA